MSELAQLVGGALRVLERLGHERRSVSGVALERLLGQLERDDGVDEALLCAVVQVAHDASPLLVGRSHDPRRATL